MQVIKEEKKSITIAIGVAKVATSLQKASRRRLVSNPLMFVLQIRC